MSSHEPTPGDADTAQTLSRNHVVVTGAGFTRAVVPGAPLLVDDFNNDDLPRDDITVVNLSREDPEAELTRRRYRSVFGDIPDERFHFGGALEWIRGLSR